MSVQISGVLKDGAGKPVPGCSIRLNAKKTSPTVVVAVISSTVTDANGHYSIEAEPGYYIVSLVREGFPPILAGDIYVAPTDVPDTLNAFLDAPKDADLRPEVMKRFEEMVNRVVDLSGATEKDRERAEQAAQSAAQSNDAAALSATAAAESQRQAVHSADAADVSARSADDNARQTAQDVLASAADADSAAKSAQAATEQAGVAKTSADTAQKAQHEAGASAQSATGSAESAASSAQTAGEHAGNAASSENAARESATAAVNAAGAAEASATQAASSAASAESSAGTATTKAGEASASAASAAAAAEVATANLETALPASAYIKDVSRHAVERASGGRQTVLYDDLGNPSVMNIIPIFRYEDLGYSKDMGAGVVSCFDVGTGTNKSEIFIGAFQASLVGSRAVSLPRADPATSVKFDTAKGYCANKGAGWHLMTMHEWAAISLWCMANGFEPRGNTNYGRAHDRYVERGRRMDGGLPGDTAGIGRVHAGSGPDAWRHNNSPWGISDLVGNVWEWLDGFKLQDGQIIASTFNTQAEASWAAQAAYFDSTMTTGGSPLLSDAVVNRLGAIGDNTSVGYSANAAFNAMEKAGTYVSNQLLKRLLVEPSTVLPKGRVYMRNFGERLPSRGGRWNNGSDAGLAALSCDSSRVVAGSLVGFRLAFA
ncbi:TPA: prophage tail fiber N-terminal domain-containing protein [Klebsiella quasipneumoniae subsp. similipneumoniae]